jgi:hypothetical protein
MKLKKLKKKILKEKLTTHNPCNCPYDQIGDLKEKTKVPVQPPRRPKRKKKSVC